MDGFDAPVCLTRSAPLDVGSGELVFYDVIDSATVSRCSVLSCIAEAGGEVVLPNSIRLPEFRTWLSATSANSTMVPDLPLASICVVLKVADALDDAHLDNWIDIAATRLTQHVVAHEQHDDSTPRQLADNLSLLSRSLQISLFKAMSRDSSQLQSLLEFLPGRIHEAIVAANITPTRMLEICLHDNSLPLVKALTTLTPAPPSVLSLNVHSPEDSPIQGQVWEQAAPHLAEVLQQHSGITSLRLDLQCIDAASAKMLAVPIATLKSLQTLHLHTGVDPSTTITLQQMLQALPQLTALSLFLHLVSQPLKSQEDASASSRSQPCLAAMLSSATSLTSLQIQARADSGKECFVTTSPLELPCLNHLDVLFDQPNISGVTRANTNCHSIAVSYLISQLSAPLTSLELHPNNSWLAPEMLSDDTEHVFHLYSSLARFTQLRCLSISTPEDQDYDLTAVEEAVTVAAPPALAQLRQLQHLRVASTVATCLATVALLTGATAMSHLQMRCQEKCNHGTHMNTLLPSFSELFRRLSFLPLCSLSLEFVNDYGELSPGISRLIMRDNLIMLTRLTALRMHGWECLNTPEDNAVLARMTGLQKLHLLDFDVPEGVHTSCVCALQALPALTSLYCSSGYESYFSDALFSEAPPRAWPALQELSMELCDPYYTTIRFRFESSKLSLSQLGFEHLYDTQPDPGEWPPWSHIKKQAATAGITVSFHDDIPF